MFIKRVNAFKYEKMNKNLLFFIKIWIIYKKKIRRMHYAIFTLVITDHPL